MNDHIGKPTEPERLFVILLNWLSPADNRDGMNLTRIFHEYSRALAGPLSALESSAQSGV